MQLHDIRRSLINDLPRSPELRNDFRRAALKIQAEAQRRAPRRTGRLRRSIEVSDGGADQHGRQVYRVGWNPRVAFYGRMVEGGTKYTRAQPHLKPAAERFEQS